MPHSCFYICTGLLMTALATLAAAQTSESALVFSSGFENGTTEILDNTGQRITDLSGIDASTGFDWEHDLEADGRKFEMNYVDHDKGPNPDLLGARLAVDPDDADNTAFYTWQNDGEWQSGGFWSRVQAEWNDCNFDEMYYRMRFRIGEDVSVVNGTDWWIWCMLGLEIKPDLNRSQHSLSVRLNKEPDDQHLTWAVHRKTPTDGSGYHRSTVPVKVGIWQTMEFYAKAGDADDGRFFLRIDGETIVDEQVATIEGGGNWSRQALLKVYGNLPDVVTDPEKGNRPSVEVWFDDLEIWKALPSERSVWLRVAPATDSITIEHLSEPFIHPEPQAEGQFFKSVSLENANIFGFIVDQNN